MRSRVNELFTQSRSAAGSRSIVSMMQEDGEQIGRFKVRGLMRELVLVSKQPGSHAYKPDTNLVIKALDMPYEQRGRPQGLLFHSDQGSQGGFNRSSQHL